MSEINKQRTQKSRERVNFGRDFVYCSKNMKYKIGIKLFLRVAIASSFLSAVADRFGLWSEAVSAWGNWRAFVEYTAVVNPWFPESMIPSLAILATTAEIFFAICLIIGFKTELFAKLSGFLLLMFALSMTFSLGIKAPFDYSVFTASAAAFALGLIQEKQLELDCIMDKRKGR